jgi:hypothetical protein
MNQEALCMCGENKMAKRKIESLEPDEIPEVFYSSANDILYQTIADAFRLYLRNEIKSVLKEAFNDDKQ